MEGASSAVSSSAVRAEARLASASSSSARAAAISSGRVPSSSRLRASSAEVTRAAAWYAYYRLRLVAPSPDIEEQAREVINAIKGLRASDSLEALDDAGESVRHRIDALIDDARTDLHGHVGRGARGRSSVSDAG